MNLTFFVWGDTHFGYEQNYRENDLRWRIIQQMNHLPGWPYPQELGGCVARPDFVMHCGDIIDGERPGEVELGYYRYYLPELAFPHYEVLGNHDIVAPEFVAYFLDKYAARSYVFEQQGIHCISLSGEYDEREVGRIPAEELRFLGETLGAVGPHAPVILFTHSRLDRLHNGDEVLQVLRGSRVLLIVSAHLHKPAVFSLGGISCIDIGHCRNHPIDPEYGRSFCVVHLDEAYLTALPWRWDLQDWERGQRWADPSSSAQRFMLRQKQTD